MIIPINISEPTSFVIAHPTLVMALPTVSILSSGLPSSLFSFSFCLVPQWLQNSADLIISLPQWLQNLVSFCSFIAKPFV